MAKFLDQNGLLYLWQKIVNKFVSKETGKGLSTNDFTTELKNKLDGIAEGAQVNVKPDWNASAGNAAEILNKPTIPSKTSDLQNDSGFITTTDIPEGAAASTTVPKMNGTAAVGIETAFARGDHVHPSDTTKADANHNHDDVYAKKDETYSKTDIDGKGFLVAADIANKADKATTLAGYGITNAYTKDEVYTKTEVDGKGFLVASDIANKADKATTLAGYGITDAFTKDEINSKLSSVYKPGGSLNFADLPAPSEAILGLVYSMNDAFTTDDRFLASEPVQYPIGTNVVTIAVSDSGETKYLFDVLAGFVDLSDYAKKTDMVAITNQEIDEIVA